MKAEFVYENIEFQKGLSDEDIRRSLRATGPIKPGEIIIRDFPDRGYKELYVYVRNDGDQLIAPHKVYNFGSINRRTKEADFIHDRSNKTGQGNILTVSFRRADPEEARAIRKSLRSGEYDKYIEEAKKKTGLTPFV
jgi:hypothetical protein